MAGARLGLMFASEELIIHMNKVKDSYNVNALTQVAGEAALRDRKHFDWLIGATIAERTWLQAECMAFGWSWPRTSANVRQHGASNAEPAGVACISIARARRSGKR